MLFTFFLQRCSGSAVGDDGRTDQGASNISNSCRIPHMVVAVPKDEGELQQMLSTAIKAGCPMAVSYPRCNTQGVPWQLPICRGDKVKDGHDVAIVTTGTMVVPALTATEQLAKEGIECAVVNARFVKPLHSELILGQAYVAKGLMTIGENALAAGLGEGMARRISSYIAKLSYGGDSRQ